MDTTEVNYPKVIVLGTGRSGSGWVAQVLQHLGIDAAHEGYFNPDTVTDFPGSVAGQSPPTVESSWLALPLVEEWFNPASTWFNPASTRVDATPPFICYHQHRHPLDVLSSLMNGEMFHDRNLAYLWWMEANLSGRHRGPGNNPLAFFTRWVAEWTFRCEAMRERTGGWSYRVPLASPSAIRSIAHQAGVSVTLGTAAVAVARVSRKVNKHGEGPRLTWDDLPDGQYKEMLRAWVANSHGIAF